MTTQTDTIVTCPACLRDLSGRSPGATRCAECNDVCDHGTPVGSYCGICSQLVTGIPPVRRLFATAAELGVPPVPSRDADLSRIRVLDRDSPEGQEELRKRAERRAKQDRIQGTVSGLSGLGSL